MFCYLGYYSLWPFIFNRGICFRDYLFAVIFSRFGYRLTFSLDCKRLSLVSMPTMAWNDAIEVVRNERECAVINQYHAIYPIPKPETTWSTGSGRNFISHRWAQTVKGYSTNRQFHKNFTRDYPDLATSGFVYSFSGFPLNGILEYFRISTSDLKEIGLESDVKPKEEIYLVCGAYWSLLSNHILFTNST